MKDVLERELHSRGQLSSSGSGWYRRELGMQRGMDNAVAVVAGLAADEFNRISARAHTRNERVGLLGRSWHCGSAWSHLHGVIVASVATGEAGSNLLLYASLR